MSSALTSLNKGINSILSYDLIRMTLLLLSVIFIGYTLKPIPASLNDMFEKNDVFKFFVILTFALVTSYPIQANNKNTLLWSVVISILVLVIFRSIRGDFTTPLIAQRNPEDLQERNLKNKGKK